MKTERCCKDVPTAGMQMHLHFHQCLRAGVIRFRGKWYCSIHNPAYIVKKDAERHTKYEAEWAKKQAIWDKQAIRAKCYSQMYKLLEESSNVCEIPALYKRIKKVLKQAAKGL